MSEESGNEQKNSKTWDNYYKSINSSRRWSIIYAGSCVLIILILIVVFTIFVAREANLWKQIVLGALGCIGGILLSLIILIYCLRIHSEAVSSLTELALAVLPAERQQ
jgi:hypothetical protein